jgi:hypothetical protein
MAEVGGQQGQFFRDPDRTGTIARGCLSRNGGACRADEGPDCRICLADRPAETTHRRFDECLPHPNDCPGWRRTNRRTPLALPNVADVWRCSLQALCRSMHAKAPGESCRTWRRGSSTPPPSDRHLEARGCVLHRDVNPKRSEHEANGGDIDERLRRLDFELVVFAQSPIAAEPSKTALDDPDQACDLECSLAALDDL